MKKISARCVTGGVLLGVINGLLGGGGGMVAVPLLRESLNYQRKQAHATAILIILPVCAVSALTHLFSGFIELPVVLPVAIGNVAGGLVGAKFLGKFPEVAVELIFIIIMLVAGVRMAVG